MQPNLSIKDKLKLFKLLLDETAKEFNIEPHQVSANQFRLIAGPRFGGYSVKTLGGFVALKQSVYPVPQTTKKRSAELEVIRKLVLNGQK